MSNEYSLSVKYILNIKEKVYAVFKNRTFNNIEINDYFNAGDELEKKCLYLLLFVFVSNIFSLQKSGQIETKS